MNGSSFRYALWVLQDRPDMFRAPSSMDEPHRVLRVDRPFSIPCPPPVPGEIDRILEAAKRILAGEGDWQLPPSDECNVGDD